MKTNDEVVQYVKGMLVDAKKFVLYLDNKRKQMGRQVDQDTLESIAAVQGKIGAFEDMLNFLGAAE